MSNLFSSSIGKKLIMSVTGLCLILFLLFHMSMNLVALFSMEAYNMVCEFLGANWYALAATLVLAGGFVIHIVYAFIISLQNQRARGKERYARTYRSKEVEWASKNMLALGIVVLVFLLLHLYNFWYKMQFVELTGIHTSDFHPTDGAGLIQDLFSNPIYCLLYLIGFAALWFHITHGFWSAFQSIGWDNKVWLKRLQCASKIFAGIIFIGFAVVVVFFYAQSLCGVCA